MGFVGEPFGTLIYLVVYGSFPKGDVLAVARVAGIAAAKRTAARKRNWLARRRTRC